MKYFSYRFLTLVCKHTVTRVFIGRSIMPNFADKKIDMLSKEQVLEIISYCDNHGVQRKVRLRELGITEWNFYKSRRRDLCQEKTNNETTGSFIQLEAGGRFVPSTVTEMERQINAGRQVIGKGEELTVECRTSRGGMVRINGKINAELIAVLVKNL